MNSINSIYGVQHCNDQQKQCNSQPSVGFNDRFEACQSRNSYTYVCVPPTELGGNKLAESSKTISVVALVQGPATA